MDLKCLRSSGVVFLQFYAAQLKYNSFAGFLVALFRLLVIWLAATPKILAILDEVVSFAVCPSVYCYDSAAAT